MVSALDQLYQQVIMDHAAEKHGSSPVTPSDTSSYQVNPTCGEWGHFLPLSLIHI